MTPEQIAQKLRDGLGDDTAALKKEMGAAGAGHYANGFFDGMDALLDCLRSAGLLRPDTPPPSAPSNAWLRGDRKAAWCTTHGDFAWQFSDGSVSCHHELVVGSSTGDDCRVELLTLGLVAGSDDSTDTLRAELGAGLSTQGDGKR